MSLDRRTFLSVFAAPSLAVAASDWIRVGCQTRAYGSPLPKPDDFFAALAGLNRAGYAGFETNFRSLEWAFDDPGPAKKRLQATGVEMIGLHVGAGLFDPDRLAAETKLVERVARGTSALGGKHVIVSGRQLPQRADGRADDRALEAKARNLEKLGALCREMGVTLSSHNHTHEVQHDADEIRRLLGQTDPKLVSLLFDVGHVHNDEVDVPAFVAQHASRIAGLHVRDVKGGDEVLIGTGKVDFPALGKALRRAKWSGWVIVEVNKRDDMPSDKLVTRAREHLRRTMEI